MGLVVVAALMLLLSAAVTSVMRDAPIALLLLQAGVGGDESKDDVGVAGDTR